MGKTRLRTRTDVEVAFVVEVEVVEREGGVLRRVSRELDAAEEC